MTEPGPVFDPARLLATLDDHGVDYVVVGGIAVIAHGSRRLTIDLDIVPAPAPENYERLAAALEELGAEGVFTDGDFQDIDPLDAFDLARSRNVGIPTSAGKLDVLNRAKGTPPYDDLRARSITANVAGREVRLAGVDDLVAMKLKSGRPVDLQDVADVTGHEPPPD